ncbi:HAMP domain-containing sensor histidine kinase [Falsarthrobacter nasiphocae]|uniref:histidine kinase n=1 Tax=Falsarthrobacter nasiphocae TaxID=189863 RepID=A0AAE4C743_9MICC|nr:HAMP domain-containing sensor histidine kinase [Falsarthrobacter nasiphocae]MDR6892149.1 two-component system OmpR family sensor kinase [Falsarthrobacter nasiphocae]
MRRALSLRVTLTITVVMLLTAVVAALGFFTHALMERSLLRQADEQLRASSSRAAHYRDSPPPSAADASAPDPLNAPGQGPGTLQALVTSGTVVRGQIIDAKTGNREALSAEDASALKTIAASARPTTVTLSAGKYRVQAVAVSDGQSLVTGLPLAATERSLKNLTIIILGVGGAAVLTGGVLGAVVVRQRLRPLERLADVADDVSRLPLDAGEVRLAARVEDGDARAGTEVGAVGVALNRMLDSVEGALEARQASEMKVRQFVADASHELRNPLAAIRGYSELLAATEQLSEDGFRSLGRVQAQARRMGTLVEDLLLLARLDEGSPVSVTEVDVTRMVLESVNDFRVAAPDHAWRLDLGEEPAVVRADERQVQQALTNLLSNARKHTAPGTEITTGARITPDGEWVVLSVTDNGEGIASDFVPHIFERFTRADQARSGSDGTTGLGLSIVDAVARSHGGSVGVESRPGRTRFEVRLPVR